VYLVEQPAPAIADEIEAYLLSPVDVHELGGYNFAVWTLIRAGDGEIANGIILTIDPEKNLQAADLALRLSSRKSFASRGE
jgi:hypothetical protein